MDQYRRSLRNKANWYIKKDRPLPVDLWMDLLDHGWTEEELESGELLDL